MLKKISATFCLLFVFMLKMTAQSQMEQTMFQSGKIYTFLAVAFIVLIGIFFYLIRLDRKLNKLENDMNEK